MNVENLALHRRECSLFSGLNFKLKAGRIILVAGPNGSGKTSLLQALAGVIIPAWGTIFKNSSSLYIGHETTLKLGFKVETFLQCQAALLRIPFKHIQNSLRQIGLHHLRTCPMRLLSAGQRRRLALSRLLWMPERLWLLDEPLVNLDKEACELLWSLIRQHLDKGGGVIITTPIGMDLPVAPYQTLFLPPPHE